MTEAPHVDVDPFAATSRGIDEPAPDRAALRAAGPIVQVDAPAGGRAWIVTDDAVARQVLADPRLVKDPAQAPPTWDRRTAGLERTAAEQPSLTTLDGPAHARLRRAHAPLLTGKRIREQSDRIHEIARDLLTASAGAAEVDLAADFTTRYPITVLLDLLGVPLDRVDRATEACRLMLGTDPADQGAAISALMDLGAAGLDSGQRGLAVELRERVPPETTADEVNYHLFALIFAGQLTTDASLGFLLARALADGPGGTPDDELVRATLRRYPPAPFTLWRYTTTEVEFAGVRLPAGAPVLVDIQGINAHGGADLSFGAGPHFCIGAQLAQLELRAAVAVLRADFPDARLTVPFGELRQSGVGGIQGTRLTALPVALRG
ncbi:cytochrome P450 [Saccharothrix deserti]|uniref:cytochrome P450 n=1 Tax=Saccharothrix deserti TaxID=2593674 RepID=UPI001EE4E501|nr:cytochrome P450 [Saccharothrix deserti]